MPRRNSYCLLPFCILSVLAMRDEVRNTTLSLFYGPGSCHGSEQKEEKEEKPTGKDIARSAANEHRTKEGVKEASHQRSLDSVHLCACASPQLVLASWLCKAFQAFHAFQVHCETFETFSDFWCCAGRFSCLLRGERCQSKSS